MKIYHIDSSARKSESVSKSLAKLLVERIKKSGDTVTYRDVSTGLPLVSGIKGSGFIIPELFIQTVKAIAPTFGGINLEDIKAPEAFEIERRLKKN